MATSKTHKTPKNGPSSKKPSSAPATPAAPSPRAKTRAHDVLDRLLAGRPPLTTAQHNAFARRFSDAVCEAMGGRTKSEGVLDDSIAWTAIMDKALKKHPAELRRYGAARFVWFLGCIRALLDAREEQQVAHGNTGAAKDRAARAQKAAVAAREELLETMEALVEDHDEGEAALARAAGGTDKPDAIVDSIRAIAKLARGWLARKDDEAAALVESVGLTLAEVEAAEAAADALADAGTDRTIEGRVVVRDTPPVNRAEGRVVLEMRAAMRIFARANRRNGEVPKLSPGPATRGVLAPRAAKAKAPDEGAGNAEQPAAGGGG